MNFILSKIISRPKSVVLSADEHRMDNNNGLESTSPSSPISEALLSTTPSSLSPLLLSNGGDSANCDQNNEIQTPNRSVVKKCLPTDNNLATAVTTASEAELSNDKILKEKGINVDGASVNGESEKGIIIITDKDKKDTDKNNLFKEKDNHTSEKELNNKILNDDDKEHVKTINVLPDIINVQPIKESEKPNDSLVTLLANNLNDLNLNSSKDVNLLNVPTLSYDGGISSDDEFYAECQTFTESTQNFDNNNSEIITANNTGNSDNDKQNWDNILSDATFSNNNDENLQQIESNLACSSDGNQTDHTIQDNEFISASNSTVNVSETATLPIETITDSQNQIIEESDSNVENSEASFPDSNKISEQLNEKNEIFNYTESSRILCDLKQSICNENYDDSLESPDMYVPQVLLRQMEKQKVQQKILSTNPNNSALESHEASSSSKTETSLDSNSDNLSKDKETSENSNEDVNNVPLEMRLSIDSLEEHVASYQDEIRLNISPNQQYVIGSGDTTSTSAVHNQIVDVCNSVEPHSDEIVENNKMNTSKVLDQTFDNFESINATNPSPVCPAESPANITFAASLEAINSTQNLSSSHRKNDALLDASFNDGTSFNHNETIPIDDLVKAANEIQSSARESLQESMEVVENDAVITSPNDNVKETENSNRSSSTNSSFKGSLNTSVEPMEIDMSPQKQMISPKAEHEIEEELSNRDDDNVEFQTEHFNTDVKLEFEFKAPMIPPPFVTFPSSSNRNPQVLTDDDFQNNPGLILSSTDFDFLLSKGNDNTPLADRSSLLLRFDPLLGHAVPVNQQQQDKNSLSTVISSLNKGRLSPTTEENDDEQQSILTSTINNSNNNNSPSTSLPISSQPHAIQNEFENLNSTIPICCATNNNSSISSSTNTEELTSLIRPNNNNNNNNNTIPHLSQDKKSDDKMSVDVIKDIKIENNDVNKSIDNLSKQSEEKQDYKMEDLEKKIKNEVLKTEDIEKKLKDAEEKEVALLKRITEKDKTMAKMRDVIEEYEKAVAELIAEKEQLKQNYERQIAELKEDRDSNYQHLLSLESTFSDLHVKYERSKQTAEKLKKAEEELLSEKRQTTENLRLQEQRYEKMKSHALQQLEIANNKLDTLSKNHSAEVTKLKALLKKEEISRLSITEQLQQKARENEQLMKICDELINGQGS